MSIVNAVPLLEAAGGDYTISRSVRLRSSASAYFNRTPASATNRKTWTWSGWVKRGTLNGAGIQSVFSAGANASYPLVSLFFFNDFIDFYADVAGTATRIRTNAVYRDPSAWYHIVAVLDTTQATAANRMLLYVNGVQVTSFSTSNPPAQNADLSVNNTVPHYHGAYAYDTTTNRYEGYLTEINFIDGQALTPSSFGENDAVTGVWKPKKYTGTYGTNGFYLNFSDNSSNTATTIGKDYSGNGNNWTPNNISVTAGVTYDSMIDVPTPYADGGNGRGNYCVLNPVVNGQTGIVNGNLRLNYNATYSTTGSMAVSSGKWYYEATLTTQTLGAQAVGVGNQNFNVSNAVGIDAYGWSMIIQNNSSNGQGYHSGATTSTYSTFTNGDVLMIAFDVDAGKIWFGKNGTWFNSGAPASGTGQIYSDLTGEIRPALNNNSNTGGVIDINFGQRPFTYTPPSGFVALNTQNLPDSTIKAGNKYFDATLYTGNGSTQSIVNAGAFQPDFVWAKSRSAAQGNHNYDSIRGPNQYLGSDSTTAETTLSGALTAFNTNGFSLGNYPGVNTNGNTYVGWQWKAGGTSSSNTNGSITSTVSAGATQGFSVVTYTGTGVLTTVGHGLGAVPNMIILKARNTTGDWQVYTSMTGAGNYLLLDTTAASAASSTKWNNTTPTSSVFSVGVDTTTNMLATTYVACCFSAVKGFSAFGSYTGNGSTDGPFIYTGFRPRYVMIKRTDTAGGSWVIEDTSRNPYNVVDLALFAESSTSEATQSSTTSQIDIVSNGFKSRGTGASTNASTSATYIYIAFAENPFRNALAR